MAARVVSETADGDAANQSAREELHSEFDRLTAEMEQALTYATEEFEQTLFQAKSDMDAETQRAADAHWAFLDGRLAAWAQKYAAEEKNAKW